MAGEADHRDPAEIARERRDAVDLHIAAAQKLEEEALEYAIASSRLSRIAEATNRRIQALCIHARLDDYIDGKDPE
jgi:hypothetical protein